MQNYVAYQCKCKWRKWAGYSISSFEDVGDGLIYSQERDNKFLILLKKFNWGALFFKWDLNKSNKYFSWNGFKSWQGPLGGSKDFDLKNQIEIKQKELLQNQKLRFLWRSARKSWNQFVSSRIRDWFFWI